MTRSSSTGGCFVTCHLIQNTDQNSARTVHSATLLTKLNTPQNVRNERKFISTNELRNVHLCLSSQSSVQGVIHEIFLIGVKLPI